MRAVCDGIVPFIYFMSEDFCHKLPEEVHDKEEYVKGGKHDIINDNYVYSHKKYE